MYKILKNTIEMDDYSVQKLSNLQPPEPFEWNTVQGTELNVSDCIGGKGKIEVKGNTEQKQLSGKNLLNFSKWTSKEVNGVRWTNNGDGTVTANGTATDNSDFYVIKDYSTKYTGDYTISGCPSGGSATTYYVLQDIGNKSDFGNGVTKSFNNESFAVRLRIMKGYTANGILFRPMIELGTTKTDFEPYCGGQASPNPDYPQEIEIVTGNNVIKNSNNNGTTDVYNLNLGNIELCKIGDYQDILFKNVVGDENYNAELENGAWYKKKAIDKKVLDDSWEWFMPTTNRFHVNITLPDGEYDLVALCDKFINALYWPTHINTDKSFIVHNGNWGNNMCRISFVDKNCASLAEWTQFVSENNLIVYYRLLNPTFEKITDLTLISQLEALRKAKWFKGVNHWWTETENLKPNLKGTYRQAINE